MPPRPKAPDADRYRIEAVDRTLLLLDAVAVQPGANPTQLAAALGANRSMVFRILTTLAKRGFVARDEQNGYRLGPRLLYLGQQAELSNALIDASRDVLDQLLEATAENVHLMVREDLQLMCLGVRVATQSVRLVPKVGFMSGLYTGPVSKAFLAFAPADVLDQIYAQHGDQITPAALRDRTRMESLLAQIRSDGFYATAGEQEPEIYTLSAPVRDGHGEVVAMITVAAPTSRVPTKKRAEILKPLLAGAAEISDRLGYRNGTVTPG